MTVTSGIVQQNQSVGGQIVQSVQIITPAMMTNDSGRIAFQVLNRNAKQRMVVIGTTLSNYTPLDQSVSVSCTVVDSTWFDPNSADASLISWKNSNTPNAVAGVGTGTAATFGSAENSPLAESGDTLLVYTIVGSPAPSTGELPVFITEVL